MFRNFWESTEVADFTIFFFLRFTAMEPIHRSGTQIGWSALAHPTWMAELYNWTPVGALFRTMVSVRQPRQDWSGANDRIWWDMIGYSYRDRRFFFLNGVEAHWYFPHIFHLGLLLDGGGVKLISMDGKNTKCQENMRHLRLRMPSWGRNSHQKWIEALFPWEFYSFRSVLLVLQ